MQYIIKEKAENIKDSVIEKTGVVVKFTMTELESNDKNMEKILKELNAKRDYEKAKMTNIETNHPFVLDLSEEDLFTAHMYQEAKSMVAMAETKVGEFEKQLADDAEEIIEIKKQLPELDIPAAVAPEVASPEGGIPTSPEFMPKEGGEDAPAEPEAPTADSLK